MIDQIQTPAPSVAPVITPDISSTSSTKANYLTVIVVSLVVIYLGTKGLEAWKNVKKIKAKNSEQERKIFELEAKVNSANSMPSSPRW